MSTGHSTRRPGANFVGLVIPYIISLGARAQAYQNAHES